jgi:hypothetical protein
LVAEGDCFSNQGNGLRAELLGTGDELSSLCALILHGLRGAHLDLSFGDGAVVKLTVVRYRTKRQVLPLQIEQFIRARSPDTKK